MFVRGTSCRVRGPNARGTTAPGCQSVRALLNRKARTTRQSAAAGKGSQHVQG